MDPRLLDLVWEAYRQSGSRNYIHVISAYRSSATNSMLRSRSRGVAKKSQHMLGKAMDFYIPDVSLKQLRNIGLKMQAGGVGYYPRSGSPFVHLDVGNVRHWPRLSRRELVAIFPSGKTLHVPSDGKPLPGFEQAVASYKARRASGELAVASASRGSSRGLLAALFGRSADEEEESGGAAVAEAEEPRRTPAPSPEPVKPTVAETKKPESQIRVVPPELANRANIPVEQAEEPSEDTPEAIIAALPSRSVPLPGAAPRSEAQAQPENIPFQVAAVSEDAAAAALQTRNVALNIPLPTSRPDYKTPAEPVEEDAISALLAMTPEPAASDQSTTPLPPSRPNEASGEAVRAPEDYAVAVLPETRPKIAPALQAMPVAVGSSEAAIAATPAVMRIGPSRSAAPGIQSNPPEPESKDVAAIPSVPDPSAKGSRLAPPAGNASLRTVVSEMEPGSDPMAAIGTGVKTTAKEARPIAKDSEPAPKPMVVAAQPQAARWAFNSESVANASEGTAAPSFAYNLVRTAPRAVYTAGFQQGSLAAVANRFTGKAVTFLSVARFDGN
jgi:hypothetical protein